MNRQEFDRIIMRHGEELSGNINILKKHCNEFESFEDIAAMNAELNNTFNKRDYVMRFYNDYAANIKADTALINALEGDGINAFEAETTFTQSGADRAEITRLKEHRAKSRIKLAACRKWLEDYGVRF